MKIISWNINGLRAVLKRGALDWFEEEDFDILCLQETKGQPPQLQQLPFNLVKLINYYAYFHSAAKKGYSGVAVYTKIKPTKVENSLGIRRFDNEGRFLKLKFPEFILINLYLPHGGRGKENLDYKLVVYNFLLNYLAKTKKQKVILIGDFNIAHKEIDLARPEQNKNNIMFTQEERKQIDRIIELGFTDTLRKFHKEGGCYTWWLYQLREKDIGWRIDYAFTSKSLTPQLKKAFILSAIKGSDHCPIGIEIEV